MHSVLMRKFAEIYLKCSYLHTNKYLLCNKTPLFSLTSSCQSCLRVPQKTKTKDRVSTIDTNHIILVLKGPIKMVEDANWTTKREIKVAQEIIIIIIRHPFHSSQYRTFINICIVYQQLCFATMLMMMEEITITMNKRLQPGKVSSERKIRMQIRGKC